MPEPNLPTQTRLRLEEAIQQIIDLLDLMDGEAEELERELEAV